MIKFDFYSVTTIDIYKESRVKISDIKPKFLSKKKFRVTEKTSEEDFYKYHRKYCGNIEPQELRQFVEQCDYNETCDTMGILDIFGIIDAISFSCYSEQYSINSYIGPYYYNLPDIDKEHPAVSEFRAIHSEIMERLKDMIDDCDINFDDITERLNKIDFQTKSLFEGAK